MDWILPGVVVFCLVSILADSLIWRIRHRSRKQM